MTDPSSTETSTRYDRAISAIDAAHALDPNTTIVNGTSTPFELHYAHQCTRYLDQRLPDASGTLRLAVRAQHFRRWETPRSAYPMTRPGYHAWRTNAKKRQAELVQQICIDAGYTAHEAARVAALIRKEDLKIDEETQALEDVACLVFLEDQFREFAEGHDEEKILGVLRKTWGKMSERGREMAVQIEMGGRERGLIEKALNG